MSDDDLSETDILLIAKQAGLTSDEIKMDPVHGMLLTVSGALKLARDARSRELSERFASALRARFGESE